MIKITEGDCGLDVSLTIIGCANWSPQVHTSLLLQIRYHIVGNFHMVQKFRIFRG